MNRTAYILKLTAPELNRFLREETLYSTDFDEIETISRALWHLTSVYKTHARGREKNSYIFVTASRETYELIDDSLTLACEAYESIFVQNTPLRDAAQFCQATHTLSRLTSIERTLAIVPIPPDPKSKSKSETEPEIPSLHEIAESYLQNTNTSLRDTDTLAPDFADESEVPAANLSTPESTSENLSETPSARSVPICRTIPGQSIPTEKQQAPPHTSTPEPELPDQPQPRPYKAMMEPPEEFALINYKKEFSRLLTEYSQLPKLTEPEPELEPDFDFFP